MRIGNGMAMLLRYSGGPYKWAFGSSLLIYVTSVHFRERYEPTIRSIHVERKPLFDKWLDQSE
jgi:hypothetical protein